MYDPQLGWYAIAGLDSRLSLRGCEKIAAGERCHLLPRSAAGVRPRRIANSVDGIGSTARADANAYRFSRKDGLSRSVERNLFRLSVTRSGTEQVPFYDFFTTSERKMNITGHFEPAAV